MAAHFSIGILAHFSISIYTRTMPEVTSFAIHVSRAVHHPKTSHTYGSQAKRTIAVLFSRE